MNDDDDDPLFPLHASLEENFVKDHYFALEPDFLLNPDLFNVPKLCKKRAQAIKKIVQLTSGRNYEVFIPYMAINYYDRYVLYNPTLSRRENSAYATYCLVLALKMRHGDFCVKDFKRATNLCIRSKPLAKVELNIFKGLDWNSIINIIIEAQTDNKLARYKHSEIASSSLLAAAANLYAKEFLNNFVKDINDDTLHCLSEVIYFRSAKNILIQRNPNNNEEPEEDPSAALIPRKCRRQVIVATNENDEEPEIPESPILGLVSSSSSQIIHNHEPENHQGGSSSASSMLVFPSSQGNNFDEVEIPTRPAKHVTFSPEVTEILSRPCGKEERRRFSWKKRRLTKENRRLTKENKRVTKEIIELATRSSVLMAQPSSSTTSESSDETSAINLRALFEAAQRSNPSPSDNSDLSIDTPPPLEDISDLSDFEGSQGSNGNGWEPPPPPPPPPPHTSPASTTRRISVTSKLNKCCCNIF